MLVDSSGKEKQDTIVSKDEVLRIVFEGEIATISSALKIGYELIDEEENLVFTSLCTDPSPSDWVEFKLGSNKIASTIPVHLLKPGNYTISIHVSLHHQKWICHSGQQEVRLGFCVINGPETSPYLDQSSGAVAIANPFYQI
ncbi:MAG: hypothetical protein EOO89_04850 [Pedobacter sp.]|nr:MAG: hypothetical protein EOO89_04850 [Pedobacter sp.]